MPGLFRTHLLRRWLRAVATFCVAGLVGAGAMAQTDAIGGPIRILVGFPAGGTIDVVTRQVAEEMSKALGVPMAVEVAAGAGGQLAAQQLKRAAPDGRTLMVAPDHTAVILPLTLANPGFDMATDFQPVGLVARYEGALAVSQASGIQDMAGLMARVRTDPPAGNVGVSAPGSKPQFLLSMLARQQGLALTAVPYRGSVPMVQDLAGGHLTAGITALGDFLEFHKAGKLKVIAVTGDQRVPQLPAVPTVTEAGHALKMHFWIGMFAPAAVPRPVVDRLNLALQKALGTPAVQERMAALVFEPSPSTPEQLKARMAAETREWAPVISASGWVRQ
ncbi:MAG: Twin-arginine translocation pathway signal [Pseudacidovorax sp.]|nr:Twin-arginine translocation pathway signal [Pseudacidovorax sp.]